MRPSSRCALSLKPNVAYRALNFCALWKKQTTFPSLAYAGIPYQVLGERAGALALMIAWSRALPIAVVADVFVPFLWVSSQPLRSTSVRRTSPAA